jgi:hypothetical protein
MESPATDALTRRVELLERQCRLWRRIGTAGLVGCLALVVGGADGPTSTEVKAERLLIQDKADPGRGILLTAQDGQPTLTFLADGQEKISLGLSKDGSSRLSFTDSGKPRLALGLSQSGAPVLNLNDEEQRRRVALGIYPKVGPVISVLDEGGKVVFRAPEAPH